MKQLKDIAAIIRSKNSGPYELTFDVIFDREDLYRRFTRAGYFTAAAVAALYGLEESSVISLIEFPPALAVKVTIVRPMPSGAFGERDVYGAQQHVPLMNMPLPGWDD